MIQPGDAMWLKMEKLKIQKYTDPKNHMLMDSHKYQQLLQDEIKAKHLMADEGFQYEVQERELKRPDSTSIKDGIKKLFLSGLLVFGCILVSILTFVCFIQGRSSKSGINREAELAAIRRQQ